MKLEITIFDVDKNKVLVFDEFELCDTAQFWERQDNHREVWRFESMFSEGSGRGYIHDDFAGTVENYRIIEVKINDKIVYKEKP